MLSGHSGAVYSAKFHPSENIIASGGHDRKLLFWKLPLESYEDLNFGEIQENAAITSLLWTRTSLCAALASGNISFWDHETGVKLRKGVGHELTANDCAFENDVVTVGDDGKALIWDQRAKHPVWERQTSFPLLACEAGGSVIYVAGVDSVVTAYDMRTSAALWECDVGDGVTGLLLNRELLARTMSGELVTIKNGEVLQRFQGEGGSPEDPLVRCAYSADGVYLCAGSISGDVLVYGSSGRLVKRYNEHERVCLDVGFHPTLDIMLSTSFDEVIVRRT